MSGTTRQYAYFQIDSRNYYTDLSISVSFITPLGKLYYTKTGKWVVAPPVSDELSPAHISGNQFYSKFLEHHEAIELLQDSDSANDPQFKSLPLEIQAEVLSVFGEEV